MFILQLGTDTEKEYQVFNSKSVLGMVMWHMGVRTLGNLCISEHVGNLLESNCLSKYNNVSPYNVFS